MFIELLKIIYQRNILIIWLKLITNITNYYFLKLFFSNILKIDSIIVIGKYLIVCKKYLQKILDWIEDNFDFLKYFKNKLNNSFYLI